MLRICFANIKNIPYIQPQNHKNSTGHNIGLQIIRWGCLHFWECNEISFSKSEHGKPFLENRPDIFFNVSHSHDYVVVAFSDHEVGVDIEKYGKKARLELVERFFHPYEIDQMHSSNSQIRLFYDYWAAKECYMKFLGCGLAGGLDRFFIDFKEDVCSIHDDSRPFCSLQRLSIDKEYASFVCSYAADEEILLFDVSKKIG